VGDGLTGLTLRGRAMRAYIGRLKVEIMVEHLAARATADSFMVEPWSPRVYADEGFRAPLDCNSAAGLAPLG
jgi:hypothetical protein